MSAELELLRAKAQAFDRFVRTLQGRETVVNIKRVAVADTSGRRPGDTVHRQLEYRLVHVYEWRFYSDGERDLEKILLKWVPR